MAALSAYTKPVELDFPSSPQIDCAKSQRAFMSSRGGSIQYLLFFLARHVHLNAKNSLYKRLHPNDHRDSL